MAEPLTPTEQAQAMAAERHPCEYPAVCGPAHWHCRSCVLRPHVAAALAPLLEENLRLRIADNIYLDAVVERDMARAYMEEVIVEREALRAEVERLARERREAVGEEICRQHGCEKPATHRMFWPGREPTPQCEEHAEKGKAVGEFMGVYIHIEPRQFPEVAR